MGSTILAYHPSPVIQWGVVIGASLVAAVWDVRTGRIPNLLTGLLLLGGVVSAGVVAGWSGLGDAAAGCLLLGVPYVLLFIFAGGGAGDAKMMAALGAWLGFSNSVAALLAVAVSGAVLGGGYALLRGRGRSVVRNLTDMGLGAVMAVHGRGRLVDAQQSIPARQAMLPMPYGLAILVGMCAALVGGQFLWHA
jgi:prepilin peptidase CpaA